MNTRRSRATGACSATGGMSARGIVAVICIVIAAVAQAAQGSTFSELWGDNGDKYNAGPDGRLLDFSYAGYAAGEADIPSPPVNASVLDFGAKGDGVTDDTKAFQSAINATWQGVLFIPEGRYIIRDFLNISTRLTLRGAGSQLSALVFPNSLGDLYGDAGRAAGRASQWSFSTGFVNYNGLPLTDESTFVGSITAVAGRGTNTLQVSSVGDLRAGQWVSITIGNPRHTGKLFRNMNMGLDHGCSADPRCFDSNLYSFQSRVASITGPSSLELERPLPFNISTAFAPASLHRWAPQLSGVGVEGVTFEMMSTKYKGHFKEDGFNALQFNHVSNAWVRDVAFIGADLALALMGCRFMTVSNITVDAPAGRLGSRGWAGHHALFSVRTADTLFTDYSINVKYAHDMSVDFFSRGVVWSSGRGLDMNMDHHKAQTYGILWTQLDLGLATRPFESGGSPGRGLDAGALTTFWNLDSSRAARFGRAVPADFGPALNFVGCGRNARYPSLRRTLTQSWWVEDMSPGDLQPPNLFVAQQALRLSQQTRVSPRLGGRGPGGNLLTLY